MPREAPALIPPLWPCRTNGCAYLGLLAVQTACATFLFWTIFPVFQHMITRSGTPQDLDFTAEVAVAAAAMLMQICYWVRYHLVPIWAPVRSAALGHVLMYAARASFFFGGALFSAFFFRHVPELSVLPTFAAGLFRTAEIMAILFALFCYSLELERLGRAIEERPPTAR